MFELLDKLKKHIKVEYILGLLTSILVPLFIMLLYWNKSISNYDGWYNLYAQDILSGRIPYVDFHFLMPPLFLYVWTLLQKIFGNYMIVFHATSVVCKCAMAGALYHTFTRFFNYKISMIAAIFSGVVMISAPFDNCTFSYNEFVTLLCIILINLFISFINKLFNEQKISYQHLIYISIINTLLFFTKQTHGMVIPFGFLIMYSVIMLFKTNKNTYFKTLGVYCISSIFTSILIFLPIMHKNILANYISNVYLGTSAKGSISDIIELPLRLISNYSYIWPLFICGIIAFICLILKNYNVIDMKTMNKEVVSKYIPNSIYILIGSFLMITFAVSLNNHLFQRLVLSGINSGTILAINQIGAIAQYVIFFMALFYFVRFFISKNLHDAQRVILYGIFTLTFISIAFSMAPPYFSYYVYGLALCALLNYRSKFQPIFEIFSIILLMSFVFLVSLNKSIIPFSFHGFSSLNVATERKVSKLNSLKGFELSKQEVDIYEDIYDTINNYLNKDDKIFCFINNTLFYTLLNRKPFYDDFYNLYWDVSPDSEAEQIYLKLKESSFVNKPKVIIYFENPEWNIILHEALFRNSNKNNYQRKIDMLLKSYINSQKYVVVSNYNQDNFYKNYSKFGKQYLKLLKNVDVLDKLSRQYDYDKAFDSKIYNEIEDVQKRVDIISNYIKYKSTDSDRFFLNSKFNLKVLVRKDVYEDKDKE